MPLPKPRRDESRAGFMRRCMENETMKHEFSDAAQRLAVCNRQYGWRKTWTAEADDDTQDDRER